MKSPTDKARVATSSFYSWALEIAERYDGHLIEAGPADQALNMVRKLELFAKRTPLARVTDTVIGLAGFGEVTVHFISSESRYFLLYDAADELGWSKTKAHAWAELEHSRAVLDQRELDEERGDGQLGYDRVRGFIDLGLYMTHDDPEAKPDAGGRRWSYGGDWLVSHDRLPWLLSCSPWGEEYMNNTMPHFFGHIAPRIWGDKLGKIPTVTADGTPTGGTLADMCTTDLTEAEALRRARRGPALDDDPAPDAA